MKFDAKGKGRGLAKMIHAWADMRRWPDRMLATKCREHGTIKLNAKFDPTAFTTSRLFYETIPKTSYTGK